MPLIEISENNLAYGGFDIERLGYIVRVCFSLGFLTEEEAWGYLGRLWDEAAARFNSWDDYIVSYMNGQEGLGTNWYSDTMKKYIELKNSTDSLYNKYPLTSTK